MLNLADVLLEAALIDAAGLLGEYCAQADKDKGLELAGAFGAWVHQQEGQGLQFSNGGFSHTSIIYAHFNCVKDGLSFSFHLDKYS